MRCDGRVDQLAMRPIDSPTTGTYRGQYSFNSPGLYTVTADGRTGAGSAIRTVSVSIDTGVDAGAHAVRSDGAPRGAVLAGIGMAVVMAIMTVTMLF